MMRAYQQCVLRKGSRLISALWIRQEHAKPGLTLSVQYTHATTGVMGSRHPGGPWVAGRWSHGWVVDQRWGVKKWDPDATNKKGAKRVGSNNKTRPENHADHS